MDVASQLSFPSEPIFDRTAHWVHLHYNQFISPQILVRNWKLILSYAIITTNDALLVSLMQ